MAKTIRIANPLPGGSSYTSLANAQSQVRRGHAEITDGTLIFRRETQSSRTSEERIRFAQEGAIDLRGTIYWNGCHPRGIYPPFCNVQIPRPDTLMSREHAGYRLRQAVVGGSA